ncbi:MAG: SDR family oxidoreductase [Chloroflexi bacterium]|nr:SDR family oxidoreductase [Chloroflexota bacterium]
MQGKTVLITGATNGIGKETARALAALGAHVVIVGRSAERTAATVEELKRSTGSAQIDWLLADLSLVAEVRRLADEFGSRFAQLDVLVNNAGAIFEKRLETSEGLEMTFALNHMSYFALTTLLLPVLKAGAAASGTPARVISVSSSAHMGGRLNFDDLQLKKRYNAFGAYANSKLANVLFAYELARRVSPSAIVSNALHPGGVATGFGKNNRGLLKLFVGLFAPIMLKPEEGAETSIYLASAAEGGSVTGGYFDKKRAVKSSFASYDEASARRLWEVSAQLMHQP